MIAFLHIPKSAGVTVNLILRSSFGLRHCDVEPWHARAPIAFLSDDLQRLYRFYPHLRSIAGHRVVAYGGLEEVCSNIQYFALLRDPLKRCASLYQYVTRKGHKFVFEDWIQRNRDAQTRQIAGVADVDVAIKVIQDKRVFIGLTERFDESILLFKAFFANDLNIAYKRMNVARDNTLAENILASEYKRQMLIEANQADLDLYAYVRQELYPSYCREYGNTLDRDVANCQRNQDKLNQRNIVLNRLYRNLVYKPALKLYRLCLNRKD